MNEKSTTTQQKEKPKYTQKGEAVEYYTEELGDMLGVELCPLFMFLGHDGECATGETIYPALNLLRYAEQRIQKMCEVIKKDLGKIEIDYKEKVFPWDESEILGVTFTPKAE